MDNTPCTSTADVRTDAMRADGGTDARWVAVQMSRARTGQMIIAANQALCENRLGVNHV
jgi:hypothetical protein